MIQAVFFCCGLGLGVIIGASLTAGIWVAAKRIAEAKFRNDLLRLKQEGLVRNNELEEIKKKMTLIYGSGPQLSERHKQILDEELSSVLKGQRRVPAVGK